ncbi:hypothetical protein, partial [Xanthomonas phaseoli]
APKTAKNRGSERGHRDRYGLPHPPIALFRPSLTVNLSLHGWEVAVPKIIFWNAEHLSPNAADIAERALRREKKSAERAKIMASKCKKDEPTRATTRRSIKDVMNAGNRYERAEARAFKSLDVAAKKSARLRNKLLLSEDLTVSASRVFFCEVLIDHPDVRSPLLGGLPAGGATLCYAHYNGDLSSDFTNCAITDGWYVGPALPPMPRVPRGVLINVSRGVAAGQAVRCCFWHAPSGNDGTIVAQMANGLHAAGQPFVLFGDLNAEPKDYSATLAVGVVILEPPGGTRISGRILDYAITNQPDFFNSCRPLYSGDQNFKIKERTGSDHMVMVLDMK